jgi:hypothetical protein
MQAIRELKVDALENVDCARELKIDELEYVSGAGFWSDVVSAYNAVFGSGPSHTISAIRKWV